MSIFWKREQTVIDKIQSYFQQIDKCRDLFRNTMQELMTKGNNEQTGKMVESVHSCEHASDLIQRDVVLELYKKALIPESRGDVLGLLETIDKVPNTYESICWQVYLEKIEIPETFHDSFNRLIQVNLEAYDLMREAVMALFLNKDNQALINRIYETESSSDRQERALIKAVFDSDIPRTEKILLKEVIITIGNISDHVQLAADRLILAVVKRRI